MTHDPTGDVDALVDRLERLTAKQLALFEHLLDVLDQPAPQRETIVVPADELRTGDQVVSDHDTTVVNTVAGCPRWLAGRRTVQVTTLTWNGDLFNAVVPADTAYRVAVPRPEPVWADDPFGTPNTVQHDPARTMTRDEYEIREAAYETSTEVAAR